MFVPYGKNKKHYHLLASVLKQFTIHCTCKKLLNEGSKDQLDYLSTLFFNKKMASDKPRVNQIMSMHVHTPLNDKCLSSINVLFFVLHEISSCFQSVPISGKRGLSISLHLSTEKISGIGLGERRGRFFFG